MGGLRKIEIASTGLTLQRSRDAPGETGTVLEYASKQRSFLILIKRLVEFRASRGTAIPQSFPQMRAGMVDVFSTFGFCVSDSFRDLYQVGGVFLSIRQWG
jgi:hypothetical protein